MSDSSSTSSSSEPSSYFDRVISIPDSSASKPKRSIKVSPAASAPKRKLTTCIVLLSDDEHEVTKDDDSSDHIPPQKYRRSSYEETRSLFRMWRVEACLDRNALLEKLTGDLNDPLLPEFLLKHKEYLRCCKAEATITKQLDDY